MGRPGDYNEIECCQCAASRRTHGALAMVDIRNVFSDNRVLSAADLSALLAFTAYVSRLCDRAVTFPHHRSDLSYSLPRVPHSRQRAMFRVCECNSVFFPCSVSGG